MRNDDQNEPDLLALRRNFSAFVKARREALGLSQDDAAGRCGMNPSSFAQIERGEVNATMKTMARILLALEVDPLKVRWD